MRLYELTYLTSSETSEEETKQIQDKIISLIEEIEDNLREITEPVKKGGAYLATLNFNLNQEKLATLEKRLKSENQILRYIILTKKLPKKAREIPVKPIKKPEVKPKPKVELKEIEKKLNEILKE